MARRNGNGKHTDPQLQLLTNIDDKLGQLVEGQKVLAEGQKILAQGQRVLVDRVDVLTQRVDVLTGRIDNMLGFIGEHYKSHDYRLAQLEERLAKAGL
jgi:hypothetical protein